MPDMDGFALTAEMRKIPGICGSTIMMLTSTARVGDGARCRALGISGFLVKPIRQSELVDAICHATSGSPVEKNVALVTRHSLNEEKSKLRVLLAEDNAVNRALATRLLEKRGHSVEIACDGKQALLATEKEELDVILMDIQMPEMDGFEATAAIRRQEASSGKHVPIIALTAHALKEDREQCLSSGMDAYLSKPIRATELLATIENVLENKEPYGGNLRRG
jgi:two-component system, sensor histidine kinase and response regulator